MSLVFRLSLLSRFFSMRVASEELTLSEVWYRTTKT